MDSLFFEIGVVIIAASVVGVIGYYLKQPLVLAYIIAGILLGSQGLGIIENQHVLDVLAELGIMFMLFLIGMEMNVSRLKDLGRVSLIVGVGQMLFSAGAAFIIGLSLGFTLIESVYLSLLLAISSTVVVVKFLSDKQDIKSLYGQISIGVLIVQDIIAVLALMVLAGFQTTGGTQEIDLYHLLSILFKGIGVTFFALSGVRLLKHLYAHIARSHELLILFSLSWCFLIVLLSQYLGFSIEIGAFIAGVSLANLPYTFEINMKARVLRDFFITIFFVALGTKLVFSALGALFLPLILFIILVVLGMPLMIMILMGVSGYDKKTSFLAALALGNISEFSLVLALFGQRLGHLSSDFVSMITVIAITSIVASSYMILYNQKLYKWFSPYLHIFEFHKKRISRSQKIHELSDHIILFGCGKMGSHVLDEIQGLGEEYLVVDHDQGVIEKLSSQKVPCVFGDVEDEELLAELGFKGADLVISTLPDEDDNYFLLHFLDKIQKSYRPVVIVFAHSAKTGMELYSRGADYVVLNTLLGARHIRRLNKEIYQIKESVEKTLSDPQDFIIHDIHKKDKEEKDIAEILHRLNEMNLHKMKRKIQKRKRKK